MRRTGGAVMYDTLASLKRRTGSTDCARNGERIAVRSIALTYVVTNLCLAYFDSFAGLVPLLDNVYHWSHRYTIHSTARNSEIHRETRTI